HPAVLTDRGLDAALESLASRAPLPVELDAALEERLPGAVEAAAFYVVSEALTNVAKYAEASLARVRVMRDNGLAIVEVVDDAVVVREHEVAGADLDAAAADRHAHGVHVDPAQGVGAVDPRGERREAHLDQREGVARVGVGDETAGAAVARGGREQLAPVRA